VRLDSPERLEDEGSLSLTAFVFAGDPAVEDFFPPDLFPSGLGFGEPLPWRLFRIFLNTPYLLPLCSLSKQENGTTKIQSTKNACLATQASQG
jgi:hypothetical protein